MYYWFEYKYLIICIIIIIIYLWYFNYQENFEVVASNASNIPCYTIESIYSKETVILKEIFRQINTDLGVILEEIEEVEVEQPGLFGLTTGGSPINYGGEFDSTEYTLINNNVSFAFDSQFKTIIKNFLQKYFPKSSISITNITNLYFKQENSTDDILYIFNVQFSNLTKFTSRNLIIKLKINNYSEFLNQIPSSANDFKSNVDSASISDNTTILGITLNKNDDNTVKYTGTYSPLVTLTPNLFTINNNLYLMDPFLTSSKEMIINDKMKTDFNKVIIEHSQTLNNLTS